MEGSSQGRGLLVTPTAASWVPTHGFIEGLQLESRAGLLQGDSHKAFRVLNQLWKATQRLFASFPTRAKGLSCSGVQL